MDRPKIKHIIVIAGRHFRGTGYLARDHLLVVRLGLVVVDGGYRVLLAVTPSFF